MTSVTQTGDGAPAPAPQVQNPPAAGVDDREQLVNGGAVGPIGRVSLPADMITRLNGIMLDFDPDLYRADKVSGALYERFVGPMLDRHPLFARAQVRDTGRGIHALLWFDRPVELATADERERWAAVVRLVQSAVPTDPACPGLTALTRPVGSVNGKTGRPVTVLKPGAPVSPDEVYRFASELAAKPFRVVAGFLLDPAAPYCPVCGTAGARLGVMDTFGHCYGGKHRPKVADLFAAVFAPRGAGGEA